MAENYDSTQMDDGVIDGVSEEALLADILRGSEIAQQAGVAPPPIPEERPSEEVSEDSEELVADDDLEQPVTSADEDDVELADTEEEEVEGTDEDEEDSTQQEVYSIDDLEDIMVIHKIDGEEVTMPLSDWIAGSATKQHLSKQGQELGAARKQIEEERTTKLAQLEQLSAQLAYATQHEEQQLAQDYHTINEKLQKAKQEDDTYEIGTLTKEVEKAQQKYWEVRSKREGAENAVKAHLDNARAQAFEQEVNSFYNEIPNLIPDWDDKIAEDIRTFAIEEGIPEHIVNTMTNAGVVKVFDDYRRLKQGVKSGAVKRKAAPQKKVPAKKAPTKKQKQASKENMVVARAMREDASPEDQMAFLRQHASKTLGGRG